MGHYNKSYTLIIALVLAVTFIGASLLPGRFERVEMLHRESRFEEATALLANLSIDRMTNAQVAQASRVYNDAGMVGQAVVLFERLRDSGRIDVVGLETLAFYYKESGRAAESHRTLAMLAADHLNERDSRNTLQYFRAYGMAEHEIQLLEVMFERDFLSVDERLRLAKIYHQADKKSAAVNVLSSITKMDSGRLPVFEVRKTYDYLVGIGELDQGYAFLSAWIDNSLDAADLPARFEMLMHAEAYALVADKAEAVSDQDSRIRTARRNAVYYLRDESEARRMDYVKLLLQELNSPLDKAEADGRVYEIYAVLPADDAFARLSASGVRDSGLYREIYYDRLHAAGRTGDLARLLMQDFESIPANRTAARIAAADKITAIGQHAVAAKAYEAIALEAGPRSGAVERLLYAWGETGETTQIDWLGTRFLASNESEFEAWEAHYLNAGPAGDLLDWLEQASASSDMNRAVRTTQLELARWEDQKPRLKRYLINELDFLADAQVEERLTIADELVALGGLDEAAAAYEDIVMTAGVDSGAVERFVYTRKQLDGVEPSAWLGMQLLSASAEDYDKWEPHYLKSGDAPELLDWLEENVPASSNRHQIWKTKTQLAVWEPGLPRVASIINTAIVDRPISRVQAEEFFELACEHQVYDAATKLAQQLSPSEVLSVDQKLCAARAASKIENVPLMVSHYQDLYDQGQSLDLSDFVMFAKGKATLGSQADVRPLYEEALAKFPPVAEQSPADLMVRAFVLQNLDRNQEAAEALETALASNSPTVDALEIRVLLGQIYTKLGNFERVLQLSCSQMVC